MIKTKQHYINMLTCNLTAFISENNLEGDKMVEMIEQIVWMIIETGVDSDIPLEAVEKLNKDSKYVKKFDELILAIKVNLGY